MKVKLLVFAAALLMLTSLSFAQPFAACAYNDGFILTSTCDAGSAPLADGTPVQIFWDANGNGPDAADVLAPLCNDPPECASGMPIGGVNFNTFVLNGGDMLGQPGTFLLDPCFASTGGMPSPARYYFKISRPNGVVWTSAVYTFVVGPQDVNVSSWTCFTPPPPSCEPINQNVVFNHGVSGPQDQPAQCATLCAQFPTVSVCVPNLAEGHIPTVTVDHACDCGTFGQASAWDMSAWVYINGGYCATITLGAGAEDGSICLHLDYILAANVTDIKAVAGDKSVNVSFKSASETNVAHYDLLRNGVLAARLDAKYGATGGEYSYVDKDLENGTTYNYSLVMVNVDNSTESFAVGAVAPSMYAQVVTEYALHQNFPNPFNPTTSIRFDLVENNFVTLKVYNANGQEVATVVNGNRTAGVNVVNFDASHLTSGLYFYTVKVGNVYSATKKMLLVK